MKRSVRPLAATLTAGLATAALIATPSAQAANANHGYDFVYDPSIIKQGKTWYVFSTGDPQGLVGNGNIQIRSSTNLVNWTFDGTMFKQIPQWINDDVGPLQNLWAPDVSYYRDRYQVYYAGSSFGTNNSVIALATNKTLNPKSKNYHWVDHGLVFRSWSGVDNYNAIDPNFVLDASGHPWLAFGSFWSGIKLVRLNPKTRKPAKNPHVYSIAQRAAPDALEAASIVYHDHYYYLFASFGFCCRGVNSTYTIHVGRSRRITGPYVDESGKPLMNGGGTRLLGNQGDMVGPGGQTVYTHHGKFYMVYHFYDVAEEGAAKLQIRRVFWTKQGWPKLGPIIIKPPFY